MKPIFLPPKKALFLSLLMFALTTGYVTYIAFVTAQLEPPGTSGDQTNIGIMELKQSNNMLYSRDYVFKDTSLFKFYTPAFVSLTTILRQWTGSYFLGLAVMVPILMFFYQTGMYFLTYHITHNNLVAILISLISVRRWWSIGATYWGLAGINAMVPRSVFLMFVPWIILFWFAWLHDKSLWKLPIIAFVIGLVGNLHPVSGFLLTQLLLSIAFLEFGFSRRMMWNVISSSVATIIGIWPTLLNFINNTNPNNIETTVVTPFAQFYLIVQERLSTLFPLKLGELVFWGYPMTADHQVFVVWAYLIFMVLLLIGYLLSLYNVITPRPPSFFLGVMLTIQLPMAFLLTRFSVSNLLILIMLYAFNTLTRQSDNWDRWLLMFMTLTICYSFIASYFLTKIWQELEWFQITTLVGEQMRIASFVYLPLFLYLARVLTLFATNIWPNWVRTGLLTGVAFLLMWPNPLSLLVMCIVSGIILVQLNNKDVWHQVWANVLKLLAWRQYSRWYWVVLGASLLTLAFIGFTQFQLGSILEVLPDYLKQQITPNLDASQEDAQELYMWAQEETNINSLFYFDSLEFRHRAQRSITHNWKDLGIAYYSQSLLVPFYERYQKLQTGYEDAVLLLSYAKEYMVDYVVVESKYNLTLDLPIAFQNGTYTVYNFVPN